MTKFNDVKVGDLFRVDAGFTCVPPNTVVKVCIDWDGLYFECDEGRHYLDGHTNVDGNLVGLEKV